MTYKTICDCKATQGSLRAAQFSETGTGVVVNVYEDEGVKSYGSPQSVLMRKFRGQRHPRPLQLNIADVRYRVRVWPK